MGYDMTWRTVPEGQHGYFRLGILGMSRYRELMLEFKMAFDDAPPPPWPRPEDFGLTRGEYWIFARPDDFPDIQLDAAKQARAEKMSAELHTVWTAHTKQEPGIPLHKLITNDGWIILPAECEAAVQAWHTYCTTRGQNTALALVGDADQQSSWREWLTYLADAATHDGFVVR